MTAMMKADQALKLKVTAKAFNATVNLDGSIKDPMTPRGIDMGFKIQVPDLKQISQLTGQPLPPIAPVELAGRAADTAPKAYKVSDLKLVFAGNTIQGNVAANVAGKVPEIVADLSTKKLDLRPLLKGEKSKEKPKAKTEKPQEKSDKVFPDDPLVLDALKTVNANVAVKAGQILLPQLAIDDFKTTVVLKNGNLTVKPLKATIGGGKLDGLVALKPSGKALDMTTDLKVVGFEVGKMMKELGVTELIEGNLDVDIDLKGRGGSVAKLMAGLDGHTSIIMSQGRIHNKYINLIGADLGSGIFQLINPAKGKKEYTAVKCMVNRFDIRKGMANTTALVFDTDLMSVVGDGKINLRTEQLDLALEPSPKKTVAGLGLSLGELAKPFKLAGTLAKPSLAIDPAKAAMMLGKVAGGIATGGTSGLAAALLGGSGSAEGDPCPAAIQAARTGVKPSPKKRAATKKTAQKKPEDQLKEAIPDVGKTLKGLFGR
ncbi:MAG: AsmA family protein [Deltaproteobacteria bacterium]|nr:AsmA family protein [Deltaproteobacteria bacterium]